MNDVPTPFTDEAAFSVAGTSWIVRREDAQTLERRAIAAETELIAAKATLDNLARTHRWNVEQQSDGSLTVCKGNHERWEGCMPEVYVPLSVVEDLRSKLAETEASLPWSTSREQNDATKALGQIYRHRIGPDGGYPEIGVVEVNRAREVLVHAYADANALRDEVTRLRVALAHPSTSKQETSSHVV